MNYRGRRDAHDGEEAVSQLLVIPNLYKEHFKTSSRSRMRDYHDITIMIVVDVSVMCKVIERRQ